MNMSGALIMATFDERNERVELRFLTPGGNVAELFVGVCAVTSEIVDGVLHFWLEECESCD